MPSQHLRSALVAAVLALLSTACGSGRDSGTDVGAVRVRVVAGAGGPALTRVHLSIAPTGASGDLTFDALSGEYGGTFTVVAGAKSVTATAYAGEDFVGATTVEVMVLQHQTSAVAIAILDLTTRPDGADHGPILGAVVASNVSPEANDAITLTASAVDPDGDVVTYAWSDDCGGVFGDASAATTTWTNGAVESCSITASASAGGLSHALSVAVSTQAPTGDLAVTVAFIPAPYVASLSLAGGPFSPACDVARTDVDASCRPALAAGTTLSGAVAFDPMPADSGATLAVSSDCGGVASVPAVDLVAGTATFTWTAPAEASACLLSATVARAGLEDSLTAGLAVVAP